MGFDSRTFRGIAVTALLSGMLFLVGCGGSSEEGQMAGDGEGIADGDTVTLSYTGTLDDGSVFSVSDSTRPFQFVVGTGTVIPGFDEAVRGMHLNETKTFTIPDTMAYGPRRDDMFHKVPKSFFPDDMTPEIGMRLQLQDNQGNPIPGMVSEIGEDSVTLDLNHQLAGEDLTFEIEVISIN